MLFFRIMDFVFAWSYAFVFFHLLKTFLPLRRNRIMAVAAFVICGYLADCIIYSNDLANLLGVMIGFAAYMLVFHSGTLLEKLSAVLVFYPALIAINYLMIDVGSRMYYGVTQATYEETMQSPELTLISSVIHTVSLILRLLFWIGAWLILRKFLGKITAHVDSKTWLIVDMLMLSSFVAVFTIIYFMPRDTAIVYPICGAAVFSSFGCMYLAAYICESIQTAYRVQELERQKNYYKDRIREEERVRSIYHDLKNHLLVWQSEAEGRQALQSVERLRSQIEGYENFWHTGNEILDIIIRDKAKSAKEKQID